jgi:hypothetical protein
MPPTAIVVHSCRGRLRLKIADRRGDDEFFDTIAEAVAGIEGVDRVRVNPAAASLVAEGPDLKTAALAAAADDQQLFRVVRSDTPPIRPLAQRVVDPLQVVDAGVARLTGGQINLPGLLFVLLVGTGIYQIARGNFRLPPWYTAFWYGLGMFTKFALDHQRDASNPE